MMCAATVNWTLVADIKSPTAAYVMFIRTFGVQVFSIPGKQALFLPSVSLVLWKTLSEHGGAAFRLLFCGLVLNDIPMLNKDSVLNAQNICGDPIHGSTKAGESPVHDHEVPVGHDRSGFVLQR